MRAPGDVTADLVRDWAHHALAGLAAARAHIDALNVFPVPDGDTGTNLYFTVEAATASVDECCAEMEPSAADAARALARGALLGARGNSGVILSQILRGAGEVLAGNPILDGAAVERLLRRGSDLAYESVAHPVEGTILTVMRAASEGAAAAAAEGRSDAVSVLERALEAAEDALERTPALLDALRLAGVVDAGGQGLVVVLQGLLGAVSGDPRPMRPPLTGGGVQGGVPAADLTRHEIEQRYSGPAFEVMYLLTAEDDQIPRLRESLDALGDSLVIVGGDGLWNVHVHVDDAGAAVEAGITAGRPYRIRITHLSDAWAPEGERRLVAVSHGPGVLGLLRDAGVMVVSAEPGARPATSEFLEAIEQAHAHEVVLLPSDKDSTGVAELAAEQARGAGHRVAVIPTRSIVQSLAAVAVHDPQSTFDDDVVCMTRAAGATRYAAVTVASRAVLTTVGPCKEGDVLGLVDGDIAIIGSDPLSVAQEMLGGMVALGGELVTLLFGSDADPALRDDLVAWLAQAHPLIEVIAHDGGQPLWPLIAGVE